MTVLLPAHDGDNQTDESDHTHKVDVHLALGILNGGELERSAYAHSGVAYKGVYAALGLNYLCYGILE